MAQNSPRLQKLDATTVGLHWALVITLLFSLTTGLRISADAEDSVWATALSLVLLQGNVMHWHIWAAYSLLIVAAAYVLFLVRARLKARVTVNRLRVAGLSVNNRKTRWQSINILVYWLAFALLFLAALTGTALYFFPGLVSHVWVILIHRAVAWLIMAYVGVHVLAQFYLGGIRQLLKVVNPRAAYGRAGAIALVLAATVGFGVFSLDKAAVRELKVVSTDNPPSIDGDPADTAWLGAPQQLITTTRGGNQAGDEVAVGVRMMHDGERLYALYEWPDATRSQKHLPLQKTANGWRVIQKEYGRQDEDEFYEDKFGVMLATTPAMAGAGTSHLGPRPLTDKPAPAGGRGLHYTTDGSNVDVWHWKSVRTGASGMNQIDDNYFGPPLEPKPNKRYTGGYNKDPKTAGGFKMNWEKFSDGRIKPIRLPKNPDVLKRLGELNLDPAASDDGEYWLPMDQTVAYSEALDQYPVGTVIPSVLVEGPFEGDRGDVRAVSSWKDGRWRLEVTRLLDTGSPYDTALQADRPTYMWVAVFNHSQTRHSLHLHPLRLVIEGLEDGQIQARADPDNDLQTEPEQRVEQ